MAAIVWLMFVLAIPTMLVLAVLGLYRAISLLMQIFMRRYE